MTEIAEIPQASALQYQLDILNNAINALEAGSTVSNLTVAAPPDAIGLFRPISVALTPPITNPGSLQVISVELKQQAKAVTEQLVEMGYAQPPPPAWLKND